MNEISFTYVIAVSLDRKLQVWSIDTYRQGFKLIGEINKQHISQQHWVPSFHLIPRKFSSFLGRGSSGLEPCQTPTRLKLFGTNGKIKSDTRIPDLASLVRASHAWNVGQHRHCSKSTNSTKYECA